MDHAVYVQRQARTHARLVAAARVLGKKFGAQAEAEQLEQVDARDERVRTLFENEALAGLLEKIAGITPSADEYQITEYVAPAPEPRTHGAPEHQPPGGAYETITYDALRNAHGEFVSPDDQDADGEAEKITRPRNTRAQTELAEQERKNALAEQERQKKAAQAARDHAKKGTG